MRIFIYEHCTGGGLLTDDGHASELASLAAEGRAMCAALVADFAAVDQVRVTCLRDARLAAWKPPCECCLDVRTCDERDAAFDENAAASDWTVVIAPEISGMLAERSRRVLARGGRLLGGSLALVDLAGDKHATAEHLAERGIAVPNGIPFLLGEPWPAELDYPALWKPLDGAGSQGLRVIDGRDLPVLPPDGRPGRLEEISPRPCRSRRYGSGHVPPEGRPPARHDAGATPASVAVLCGPVDCVCLPPCRQFLDDNFRYLGGSLPLSPSLAKRAMQLAHRTISTLPEPLGYIGIDLVLDAGDGQDDVVIEINPRLTTSYLGLRAACRENLAAALLAIGAGQRYALSFREELIKFSADETLARAD